MEMPVGDGHNEGRGAMSELALLMVWPQAVFNDDYLSATSRNASGNSPHFGSNLPTNTALPEIARKEHRLPGKVTD